MRVNSLPRIALDSGAAGIRTRDLLIASPAPSPTVARLKWFPSPRRLIVTNLFALRLTL